MNNPMSPEPISNAAESGMQSGTVSASTLGQQLLSRLVQPAGLMDVRHLPGHRTQAAAQTLLQRSQLPEKIQARYTAVEPVQAMAMPDRSRVESLALGSLDYPALGRSDRSFDRSPDRSPDRPDVGVAIGMPTLAPTIPSTISRFSDSDSQSRSSSSESSGVPRVQLATNPEPPPVASTLPITTGSFRVSRQRNAIASSSSIAPPSDGTTPSIGSPSIDSPTAERPVLRQLVNPVSSPLNAETGTPFVVKRSPIPNSPISDSPILNSQSSISNSQLSTPVSLDSTSAITPAITPPVIARQPEPSPTPVGKASRNENRPSLVLQSPSPNVIQTNAIETTTVQPNAIQPITIRPNLIQPITVQSNPVQPNSIQAMPLTPTPRVALNLPSSNSGVQITTSNNPQIAMNPIDRSPPTETNPVPRISRSLLPEIADRPSTPPSATPLPLTQLRSPTGPSIVQMFTEPTTGELSTPPTSAITPPSPAQSTSSPSPDIKRIAAQVSQLLQRQLTVEHERRGLKSW